MSRPSLYRRFVAPRTTVAILVLVASLVALFVVVPQESVVGPERIAEISGSGGLKRVLLMDVGLARLSTSPVFLGALGLFFLNLLAVLVSRFRPTLKRIEARPLDEQGVAAWARQQENVGGPLPSGWSAARATDVLRGFGYAARRTGDRALWGVKHRSAPLGFLLFHASFFLVCGGGALLYYTRFRGTVVLTEGQRFEGNFTSVQRMPPLGGPPALVFEVVGIDPRRVGNEPVYLGATIRFVSPGGASVDRPARVNAPARWGSSTLLVESAGVSTVFWLQDARGFTLDRVAVPARAESGGMPTEAPLVEGRFAVRVHPLAEDQPFPSRERLAEASLRVELVEMPGGRVLLDRPLRAGQVAEAGGVRLVVQETRFWVQVMVVAERGGGLLIAGFVLGTLGVTWRLLLYRREVGLTWTDDEFRLVGRCEYFSLRFRQELGSIGEVLGSGTAAKADPDAERREG